MRALAFSPTRCTMGPESSKGSAPTGMKHSRSSSFSEPTSTTSAGSRTAVFCASTFPHSPEELTAITLEILRRNAFRTNVYIRPLAYKSAERVGVSLDDQDAFAIVALPFGEYLPADKGVHAGVSSWRRIEDNAIPPRAKICGAYVNSALASADARLSGFDEAILLNERRPRGRGRHLQHLYGAQGKADHAAGDGERAGRDHARLGDETRGQRTGHRNGGTARSTAANSTFATNCSSPAPPWP